MYTRPARVAIPWLVLLVVALYSSGCSSDLPHDMGVVWECSGRAIDNGQPIALIGAGGVEVTECANPNVLQGPILAHCKDDCESKFRAWGFFWDSGSLLPSFWRSIDRCEIDFAVSTGRHCDPPDVRFYNGGPAQGQIALASPSTAHVEIEGHSGDTTVVGDIDFSIGPRTCSGPDCNLLLSRIGLSSADFDISGKTIHNVFVQNDDLINGTWHNTNTFDIPAGALKVGINFDVDSDNGSITLTNTDNIHGTLNRDGANFTLAGSFAKDNVTVTLSLTGQLIAHPPVAHLSPKGTIQCDGGPPGVAHITFSSAASVDPDNDIVARTWRLDGGLAGNAVDQPAVFGLGPHTVEVGVIDSRGAWDMDVGAVTVVDTVPPSITAPANASFQCASQVPPARATDATASDVCSTPVLSVAETNNGGAGSPMSPLIITRTYTATDASGNQKSAAQTITVIDNTPPVLTVVSPSPATLWPPDHRMVGITVGYDVTDNCDAAAAIVCTLAVASNEPIDGLGDGDTAPDWVIVDAHHVRLRAERAAYGSGRTYTITATCRDTKGNASSRAGTVKVPFNQS